MLTFLEIQTEVRTKVIDGPAAVVTLVPRLVNRAVRDIQRDYNFKVMEAKSELVTVLNTRVLGVQPANFKEFHGEPWWTEDSQGATHIMSVAANREGLVRGIRGEATGSPQYLLQGEPTNDAGAVNWEVWPLPDGLSDYVGGEYRVTVPYYKYLTVLAADGDTNWFTENADEYIVAKAVARAFGTDWDEQRAAVWEQFAANFKNEVVKADKRLRISAVKNAALLTSGARAPLLRR